MRKYTLASSVDRPNVDLRVYAAVITEAVHAFMPTADVRVERDCYYVSPTPTQGEAIQIGRQICQYALKHYCIQIPKLFSSIEIKEEPHEPRDEKYSGGHF